MWFSVFIISQTATFLYCCALSFSARALCGINWILQNYNYSVSFSFASNKEVLKAEFSRAKSNLEKVCCLGNWWNSMKFKSENCTSHSFYARSKKMHARALLYYLYSHSIDAHKDKCRLLLAHLCMAQD